jgi:hypothetical protein
MAARVVLHGIGRPYFKYPPLEDNAWYLPEVLRWEEWNPEFVSYRWENRLVGRLILPSYVRFRIPTNVYLGYDQLGMFKNHLRQRYPGEWVVDSDKLSQHLVTAEKLDRTVSYDHPSQPNTRHFERLPALPSRMPKDRLLPSLVRGVFRDGYSRKDDDDDGSSGHTALERT